MSIRNFTIKIITIVSIILYSVGTAFANWPDHGMMGQGYNMIGSGMGWMMILFWALVLGILILTIRWVLNLSQNDNHFSEIQTNALQILKQRFAKGEIDIAEFELKKQIIDD
jgi:putative membrane protein